MQQNPDFFFARLFSNPTAQSGHRGLTYSLRTVTITMVRFAIDTPILRWYFLEVLTDIMVLAASFIQASTRRCW